MCRTDGVRTKLTLASTVMLTGGDVSANAAKACPFPFPFIVSSSSRSNQAPAQP
jgi:hypothetical protein